jgi:hypothetical protein
MLRRRWIIIPALVLPGAAGIFIATSILLSLPGGMRPDYRAVDGDWELTREARPALQIIAAIDTYHAQTGVFPADIGKLSPLLPNGQVNLAGNNIDGWIYFKEPTGFTLGKRLGWDPGLRYERIGGRASWVFDPGDGSPAKTIALNP